MTRGLVAEYDLLEVRQDASISLAQSGMDASAYGGMEFQWASARTNAITQGLLLSVSSTDGGAMLSDGYVYNFKLPGLSINQTSTGGTTKSSMTHYIEIDALRVFAEPIGWAVYHNDIRWYVDGVLTFTHSATDQRHASTYLTPLGIPIIGAFLEAIASASVNPAHVWGAGPAGSLSGSGSITMTKGVRAKIGSDWITPDVTLPTLQTPSKACGTSASPTLAAMSVTNTYDLSISGDIDFDDNGSLVSEHAANNQVFLIHDLGCDINRVDPDVYRAMWYRGGLPNTELYMNEVCYGGSLFATTSGPDITYDEVHQQYSEILSSVTGSSHVIEDPLDRTAYAFCQKHAHVYEDDGTESGTNGVDWTTGFNKCDRLGTATDFITLLDHISDLGRYVNSHVNPHWSYFLWFPSDLETGPIGGDEWPINSTRALPEDYWTKIRDQRSAHTALPRGENTQTRSSVLFEPLYYGGLSSYIVNNYFGNTYTSWVGLTRFDVEAISPLAEDAYDSGSSSLWSATDASLAFGAGGVTVTADGGITDIEVKVEIASYSQALRIFAYICKQLKWDINDSGDGYSNLSIALENPHGDEVEIATAFGSSWVDKVAAKDSKYAGDWDQDWAVDLAVTIEGADTEAEGESATIEADALRSHFYQLLLGWGAKYLKFSLTLDTAGDAIEVAYPEFKFANENGRVTHLTAYSIAHAYENAPGWKIGQLNWYDGAGGLLTTPTIRVPGTGTQTVLDLLVMRNLVYLGVDKADSLSTYIAALYSSLEGTSYANLADDTEGYIIDLGDDGACVFVNTLREVPPLALLPRPARDANLAEGAWSGSLVQACWSHCQEPRRLLSPHPPMHVFDGSPEYQYTTDMNNAPAGWSETEHSEPEDGTELDDARLLQKGDQYATVSPWHGYLGMIDLLSAKGLTYDVTLSGRHVVAHIDEDNSDEVVVSMAANYPAPLSLNSVNTGITGVDWIKILWHDRTIGQQLILLSEESGDIKYRTSNSVDGSSWSMPTTIASGSLKKVTGFVAADKRIFIYWIDGSAIKGEIFDARYQSVAGPFTAVASGVDDDAIDCHESTGQGQGWRAILWYRSSGNITQAVSKDGQTFT